MGAMCPAGLQRFRGPRLLRVPGLSRICAACRPWEVRSWRKGHVSSVQGLSRAHRIGAGRRGRGRHVMATVKA